MPEGVRGRKIRVFAAVAVALILAVASTACTAEVHPGMHAEEAGHSEPFSDPDVQMDCSLKAARVNSTPTVNAVITHLAVFEIFRLPVSAVVSDHTVSQGELQSPLILCFPTHERAPPQIFS